MLLQISYSGCSHYLLNRDNSKVPQHREHHSRAAIEQTVEIFGTEFCFVFLFFLQNIFILHSSYWIKVIQPSLWHALQLYQQLLKCEMIPCSISTKKHEICVLFLLDTSLNYRSRKKNTELYVHLYCQQHIYCSKKTRLGYWEVWHQKKSFGKKTQTLRRHFLTCFYHSPSRADSFSVQPFKMHYSTLQNRSVKDVLSLWPHTHMHNDSKTHNWGKKNKVWQ